MRVEQTLTWRFLPRHSRFYILVRAMSHIEPDEIPHPATTRQEAPQARQLDPFLSSLFISLAALLLAVQNPINVRFQPYPYKRLH